MIKRMHTKHITVGKELTLQDITSIISTAPKIAFDPDGKKRSLASKKHVFDISKDSVVYGVNTGFGPMAYTFIGPEKQTELQYNLIRSHACGMGAPLPAETVRAIMLVRLHTLAKGYSGASDEVLTLLATLLEKNITPVVPEHGSVGASGDLVQLAHVALVVIGEGEVFFEGTRQKTTDVFTACDLSPATLSGRDGLALINGTAAMTGIAAVNILKAHTLMENAILHTAFLYEIIGAHTECIDDIIFEVRPHPGQKYVTQKLQELVSTSTRVQKRTTYTAPDKVETTTELQRTPQEIYSLRCAPQILGPIYDTISNAEQVIVTELNSVTDNPIIKPPDGTFHNGNFHGDYVSLEMDKCRIATTKLSLLLERQLNFLLNPKQNGILPPFSNGGIVGLNLGLQAAQFVATSTAAENQTLATPMSTHTISTNNDNQDIVSMGTNSALLTSTVIANTFQIQSILCATIAQSLEVLGIQNQMPKQLHQHYVQVREIFPFISDDIVFSAKMESLCEYLKL